MEVRYYGKARETVPVPHLTTTQTLAYDLFLQSEVMPHKRQSLGLEYVFRASFPIESLDGKSSIDYISYSLKEPRYTPDECRALGITYAMPLWVKFRLNREEPVEETVYLGDVPRMVGGGEFIINGAERIIVTQLQRSPGVDFSSQEHTSGKKLFVCRVIPEYGSWLQVETSSREELQLRIDNSNKLPFTLFLRCFNPEASTNSDIIRLFYETRDCALGAPREMAYAKKRKSAVDITNPSTGEIIVEAGEALESKLQEVLDAGISTVTVITKEEDPLILTTLRGDDTKNYEDAIKKLYLRLRMSMPPNLEKARELFAERFLNLERFSFGEIGRFRINREFGDIAPADQFLLTFSDLVEIAKKILRLRKGGSELDDIDHLGHRRTRTINELLTEELRVTALKLKRATRERMSQKDLESAKPSTLINRTIFESAINHFFERSELSQIVDQTNPLSQLVHERRLSALGPGGLHRKRAGYEVRDVHHSHYGRICPIETPEGANIGLIVSLSIYAGINELGFVVTPYLRVRNGVVTGEVVQLRADEEEPVRIADAGVETDANGHIVPKRVVVRYKGDYEEVEPRRVDYIDVSPRQMVGVSASLIPFLENDDTSRALMGSNMQRQAVPLLAPEQPLVSTGMEKYIPQNSGMIICTPDDATITYVDAKQVQLDNGDMLDLRKFQRLNERTCLNQRPIVKAGQQVKKGEPLVDGVGTRDGELSLGRNILVAFMPWEGYKIGRAHV